MDNGIENFYRILKNNGVKASLAKNTLSFKVTDRESFIELLVRAIEDRLNTVIFVYKEDEKTGETRNIKKDWILIQYGKQIKGRNVLKEKVYSSSEEVAKEMMDSLNKGSNSCILCGRKFKRKSFKLKQAIHPLITKIKSFSGVRSPKLQFNEICPICYLIGALEWSDEGIIYRTIPNSHSIILLPKITNLKKGFDMKQYYISAILSKSNRWSNIRVSPNSENTENTVGKYNTLLCFYEKFIDLCCLQGDGLLKNEFKRYLEWTSLDIPSGNVKNVKIYSLSVEEDIFGILYELISNEIFFYKDFLRKVIFVKDTSGDGSIIDNKITAEVKEKMSKYFLEDDFMRFTSSFMPRKKGRIILNKKARNTLDGLIIKWRLKKMSLEKKHLGILKASANVVAEVSTKRAGLLYRLEKVRTQADFWESLREISRKVIASRKQLIRKGVTPKNIESFEGLIDLFKSQKDENWKEIKNLLVIYSCMYYYIKTYKGGKEE